MKDVSEKNNLIEQDRKTFDLLMERWKIWNKELIDPIFLGLSHDKKYNELNPKRFVFEK
jgi:hypothetical protein